MNIRNLVKLFIPNSIIEYRRRCIAEKTLNRRTNTVSLSQAGQDYWVYGEVFNEAEGFFLDVGAYDGVLFSNTFILEKRYNWKGICIEGNPQTFQKLVANRQCKCIEACVDEVEGEVEFSANHLLGGIVAEDCDNDDAESETIHVKSFRLDQILEAEGAPHVIDYLSIDIEGAEDRALLTFPFDKYQFNCITIERPSDSLRKVLSENGYLLIKDIPTIDAFYIHESYKPRYIKNQDQFGLKRFLISSRYDCWEHDPPVAM